MAIIKINGADFYYEDHGKGKSIILIAGYTCDSQFYMPIVQSLKDNFRIIIFDNRAVGRTKDDGKELSADIMADDVSGLIDALGLEKPHVIGQSMGGTIAQRLASKYPEKLDKLVLLATTSKWRQAAVKGLGTIVNMIEEGTSFDNIYLETISWIFGEEFLSDDRFVNGLKEILKNPPYPQSLEDQKRQLNVLETFDGRENLKDINAETMVAYGVEDILSLPGDAKYLANNINNSQLVTFSCGHDIPHEKTKELAEKLIEFLGN